MSDEEIVAKSLSKQGGKCRDCGSMIARQGLIYKINSEGVSTIHGQGPGRWVCPRCAENYDDPKGLRE